MVRYRFGIILALFSALLIVGLSSVSAQTAPPAAPTLFSPGNNVTTTFSRPIFAWTMASGATGYQFRIFNASWTLIVDQAVTPLQAGCGAGRCSIMSPIWVTSGQQYHWRVISKNSAGWTFSTINTLNVSVNDPRPAEMLALVNQRRCQAGRVPLALNATLTHAARLHSARMAIHNFFDHTDPYSGLTPFQRMQNFGYSYTYASENIAYGSSTVSATFNQWWNSTGHRNNMMNANFREMGLGYRAGGRYGHYWTMKLGRTSSSATGVCP
jgi:hypothetical protein